MAIGRTYESPNSVVLLNLYLCSKRFIIIVSQICDMGGSLSKISIELKAAITFSSNINVKYVVCTRNKLLKTKPQSTSGVSEQRVSTAGVRMPRLRGSVYKNLRF